MTFTNGSQMPRDWATLIFCNMVSSLMFPFPFIFLSVISAQASSFVWAIVFGLIAAAVLRGESSRYWRRELYLRLRHGEAIRLTKYIQERFQDLEEGRHYASRDVTLGHECRVIVDEGTAYIADPTGYFLIDPKRWPIALWAEDFETFNPWDPQPATPGQLNALIHRLKTYR